MATAECVVCGRPTPDGYACVTETSRAAAQLRDIIDMVPAARDIAHGFAHRTGGGSSGKPGSRLPLDLGATARLDGVQAALTTWARHIAEVRGVDQPEVPVIPPAQGPVCRTRYGCDHESCKPIRDPEQPPDLTSVVARWLLAHMEWSRHRPEVEELLADIAAAARVVAGIARGPAEQKYLGPCGAQREHGGLCVGAVCFEDDFTDACACWCHEGKPEICDGDVYAPREAQNGRCRACKAEVASEDRRAWLDAQARSHAFRAAHIADAYGLSVDTIRSWATRGLLLPHGTEIDKRTGRPVPTYNVGDVLNLAATTAARRAEAQAKRARRKENAA